MLETKRLILKPFEDSDFDDLLRHRSDERVMEYLGGTQDPEKVRQRLKFYSDNFKIRGYGMCAMFWKETGEFIGVGGLQDVEDGSDVEVGYTVDPLFWRRGVATECTIACLTHGFEVFGLERIIAQARSDNAGSRVVMEKAGMSFLDNVIKDGEDWVRYVLLRESWKSLL